MYQKCLVYPLDKVYLAVVKQALRVIYNYVTPFNFEGSLVSITINV